MFFLYFTRKKINQYILKSRLDLMNFTQTFAEKVTVIDDLEAGTYYLDFTVVDADDDCATGTLTVLVTNSVSYFV